MNENVWFIAKPGDERKFATPTPPSPEWAKALKKAGYKILRVTFSLPGGFDSADTNVLGGCEEETGIKDVTDP